MLQLKDSVFPPPGPGAPITARTRTLHIILALVVLGLGGGILLYGLFESKNAAHRERAFVVLMVQLEQSVKAFSLDYGSYPPPEA